MNPEVVLPGERVLLDVKPSLWFILFARFTWLWVAVFAGLLRLLTRAGWAPAGFVTISDWLQILGLALLAWNALDRACRRYTLTDRRILRVSGVLRRVRVEVPLANVQSVTLLQIVRERILTLGTLGVSTAGSQGFEFTWFMIARPDECLAEVRKAVAAVQGGGGNRETSAPERRV